jgi:hypothetical protein
MLSRRLSFDERMQVEPRQVLLILSVNSALDCWAWCRQRMVWFSKGQTCDYEAAMQSADMMFR